MESRHMQPTAPSRTSRPQCTATALSQRPAAPMPSAGGVATKDRMKAKAPRERSAAWALRRWRAGRVLHHLARALINLYLYNIIDVCVCVSILSIYITNNVLLFLSLCSDAGGRVAKHRCPLAPHLRSGYQALKLTRSCRNTCIYGIIFSS